MKVVSGNVINQTQTATLVVENRYQNFAQETAYATAFMLAFAAVLFSTGGAAIKAAEPIEIERDIQNSQRAIGTPEPQRMGAIASVAWEWTERMSRGEARRTLRWRTTRSNSSRAALYFVARMEMLLWKQNSKKKCAA